MTPLSFDLRVPVAAAAASSGPRIQPRQWQRSLIQLLRARSLNAGHGGADVLVHAGPGAGKTLGALLSFGQLRREGRLQHVVVFCHRSSIARQWCQAAERLGLDPRGEVHTPDGRPVSILDEGRLVTELYS